MTAACFSEAVKHLAKSFRAGVPLRTALDDNSERYGSLAWSTPEAQKALLNETILYTPKFSNCTSPFTFGTARCARFMRLVMDEIDHVRHAIVDESFAEYAAQFCQSNSPAHQDYSYVVFEVSTGKANSPVRNPIIRVSQNFNDLGHRVWEAGLFLYAQLVDVRSELRRYFEGRRVLELGAGTGLSAAAYIEAGVDYALLTDYQDNVVSNMEDNIAMNLGINDSIECCVLNAEESAEVLAVAKSKRIDMVVAADVTYDKDLLICMVNAFEDVVVENRIGLLVVTKRNEATAELLKKLQLSESKLDFQAMELENVSKTFDYLGGWDFSRVSVYRVQNKDRCRSSGAPY